MPRTGRVDGSPRGVDVAVARIVARELGRSLEFHWCASASCSWKCVRERRCDVVIGQPHGSGPARDIAWSIPYSGSRFGLVVHRDEKRIRSSADLHGKRVGIVAGSIAIAAPGHDTVQCKTREELLDQFITNRLDAALVDDDFAAWYLHQHPQLPVQRVKEYVPRERWNTGFAVRAADAALLDQVNRALTKIVSNGQVSKVFTDSGIVYRAPFAIPLGKPASTNSWKRICELGEIAVTFDPANLPYSSAREDRPGFDLELARALARKLGVKLRTDWIDVQRETALGRLLDGKGDLAFGAAIEPQAVDDEEEVGDRVLYSRPYYGTGYLLVTRKNGPSVKSLAEMKGERSRRIGAEAGSVADYSLRQRGYLRSLFRTQLSVLKSLSDGGIDCAYLWANVGWTLHTSPEFDVAIVTDYLPEDHWNVAVAMRRGDDELKRHVDGAIQELLDEGDVARALSGYHVPFFPPFEVADGTDRFDGERPSTEGLSKVDPDGVIRREPTDRGPEPRMQRRQRSKQRYTGMQRIRSAGVLVVGLDQNSLPSSAAHPEPAGLDYEIAALVAERLGVSLRVYWAYSSHDSYPSKLAAKELCDVMFGVMPDDRFGERVAFSKPYYYLDYRFVVAADAPAPTAQTPCAVERGVALRDIRGRPAHEYPSLDSILAAVVEGKEQAGYVISTRGQWLAEARWPGKLRFLRSDLGAMDRFPICAATRKSDGDLNKAIDRALDELVLSGKLAEVFTHWHIPYDSPRSPAQSR
ncbi:MAG: transporter substrate-binding domain-containing protein [Planctomycetia bacterium]|nr:transporter substrate-binding domain-containing protein [Planctomycetia bacterium]